MARTHGKILCTIWHDDDFTARSAAAQRLYMVIVSQAKVNLVGLLDYRPKQLASLAPDTSIADVEDALEELIRHRFVLLDTVSDELLIRSFTRSDPIQMANSKLRKGIWSAWAAIESTALREAAVHEMPDDLFEPEKDRPEVPPAARRIRRSARMEPAHEPGPDPAPDPTIPSRSSDSPIDPPTDSSATSTSTSTTTSTSAARSADDPPVDNPDPQTEPRVGATTLPDGTLHLTGTGRLAPVTHDPPLTDDERALALTMAQEIRTRLDHVAQPQPQPQLDHEDQHA